MSLNVFLHIGMFRFHCVNGNHVGTYFTTSKISMDQAPNETAMPVTCISGGHQRETPLEQSIMRSRSFLYPLTQPGSHCAVLSRIHKPTSGRRIQPHYEEKGQSACGSLAVASKQDMTHRRTCSGKSWGWRNRLMSSLDDSFSIIGKNFPSSREPTIL